MGSPGPPSLCPGSPFRACFAALLTCRIYYSPPDEESKRTEATALEGSEGILYKHLERARPDWFSFLSKVTTCRLTARG